MRAERHAILLAAGFLMFAPPAATQTCPQSVVCGTVEIGDHSTPIDSGVTVWAIPSAGTGMLLGKPQWGATICSQLGEGSWSFLAIPSGWYFPTSGGAAICVKNPANCIECGGGFGLQVFANQGALSGHVTVVPQRTPPTSVLITGAECPGGGYGAPVDSAGRYEVLAQDEPGRSNNWGLAVDNTAAGGGPGSKDYVAVVGPAACNAAPGTTVTSSRMSVLDVAVWDLSQPPADIQWPGDPGCPVNVFSGNMYLKQADTAVPGLGMGLNLTRTYNSLNAYRGMVGAFGRGWTHSYEQTITLATSTLIRLTGPNGVPLYFEDNDANGVFKASVPLTEQSQIVRSGTSYVRQFRSGGSESYETFGTSIGYLTSIVDPSSNAVTLIRNPARQITGISEAGGRSLTLGYTGAFVTSLSGPSGLIATYAYDGDRLQSVTYAEPAPYTTGYSFTYDPSGQLLTLADFSGRTLETHTYSGNQALTSEIAGGQELLTFAYAPRQTTVTDALNNVTTYEYVPVQGMRRIARISGPCASCGGGGNETQEWTYDSRGNIASHKDGAGNVTTYTYDPSTDDLLTEARKPEPVTNPSLTYTTTYTYYPDGRVKTRSDPDEGFTSYTYVAAGPESITERITAATSTAPAVTRTTGILYTPAGKPRTVTDPRGKVTTLEYYPVVGDLKSVTDPLGHVITFTYDPMGRRKDVIDAAGHTTTTEYDEQGRVRKIIDPYLKEMEFIYDKGGRREKVIDALDRETKYGYDPYGRLETVTDARGGITTYGYDSMSNLRSLKDANHHVTEFRHDAFNRVKKVIYPNPPGGKDLFTYDGAGRLQTKTDRRAIVTTYGYDGLGRLTSKTFSDGTTPPVSYTYDPMGRLATATNNSGVVTRRYNLAGELLSEASTRNGSTLVAYTYDPVPNVRTMSLNGAPVATYLYDDDSLLKSITRGSNVFGFDYWETHNRRSLLYPNGVATSYTYYDDASRLKSVVAAAGAGPVLNFGYEYDDVGNRKKETTPTLAEEYGYDEIYRLREVKRNGTPSESYTYDDVGNRETALGLPDWSYNDQNQLLSQNGASYEYDANGNLQQKVEGGSTWTYTWDAENQLTAAFKNGVRVSRFVYDAIGRRVLKGDGSVQTRYVYDGEDILREDRSDGNVWLYIHGPGIDEALAREDQAGGTWRFFHADGLGSRVKTTNSSGAVTVSWDYDAFGQILAGAVTGYSYTGREYDTETGLYYYRARYYDPRIGRFIGEDPIPYKLRPHTEGNAYPYARNDPVNRTDPFGLESGNIWRDFPPNEKLPPMCPFGPDKCTKWGRQWQDWGFKSAEDCITWTMKMALGFGLIPKGAEELAKAGRLGRVMTGARAPGAIALTYSGSVLVTASLECNLPVCLRTRP